MSVLSWAFLREIAGADQRVGLHDGDARRAEHPLTEPVAGLVDLRGRGLGDVVAVRVRQCLVDLRVEGVTGLTVGRQTQLDGRLLQRLGNGLETALELAVLARPADV